MLTTTLFEGTPAFVICNAFISLGRKEDQLNGYIEHQPWTER